MGLLVQLEDAGDGAVQEGAVVRDDDGRARQPGDEPLQPVQAGEVEVVGGLVEEEDVEPGQQHRGQCSPRRLTAGEHAHGHVETISRQADVGQHRAHAGVEVVTAEGDEVLEGVGVLVDERGVVGHRLRQPVQRGRGLGHTRAASEVGAQGLVAVGVDLLREVPDGERRGRPLHRPRIGLLEAGEHAQQRRLADAVGAHHADAAAGADQDRHLVEHHLGAAMHGHARRR